MVERATTVTFPDSPGIRKIALGRDADLEAQLFQKSNQKHILEHTPKDAEKRFSSEQQFVAWLSKGRTLHWLLGENRDLAGVIWYGKSALPEIPNSQELHEIPEETFAIRLYEGYAGKGLARAAMTNSLMLETSRKVDNGEQINGIWLQTDVDNEPARATYTKFGYEEIHADDKRVTMVLHTETIAQIAGIAGVTHPQIS